MPQSRTAMPDVLASDAAKCMLPGLATPAPAPVVPSVEPARAGLELELLFGNLCAALQRVKKTDPGSGDRDFIRSMRGRRFDALAEADRKRLMTLRWRYRFQLPEGLRPISLFG